MKNKLCYILLGLLVAFSFINNVFADDFNVTVNATANNTTVVKGEEVSIKINIKSDSAVDLCSFKVTSDSTLEYVSMSEMNNWKIYNGTIANFTMENNIDNVDPLTNGVNIVEIKYRVNGDGKVTVDPVECAVVDSTEASYEDSEIDSALVQITAEEPVDDTSLSNIVVNGGDMPSFSSDRLNYTVKLKSSTFGLTITASNPDYQDDIVVKDRNGNIYTNLNNITWSDPTGQGIMLIDIVVNNKTTYTLATSYVVEELDNSLASLTINGENILEPGKYDYEHTVSSGTTNFDLGATLKDSDNFQFASGGNSPGNFSMGNEGTAIVLIVEPKDSSIGAESVTYTIEVVKESSSSATDPGNSDGNSGDIGGSGNTEDNATSNPGTGDISMFIMAVILISSLVGSVILYQKNLESYK
ncbi:MAG: hypothetical protein IJE89_02370 [Bacilli bacterium]|nr:hypothetical protein [Bacilli bacterium]